MSYGSSGAVDPAGNPIGPNGFNPQPTYGGPLAIIGGLLNGYKEGQGLAYQRALAMATVQRNNLLAQARIENYGSQAQTRAGNLTDNDLRSGVTVAKAGYDPNNPNSQAYTDAQAKEDSDLVSKAVGIVIDGKSKGYNDQVMQGITQAALGTLQGHPHALKNFSDVMYGPGAVPGTATPGTPDLPTNAAPPGILAPSAATSDASGSIVPSGPLAPSTAPVPLPPPMTQTLSGGFGTKATQVNGPVTGTLALPGMVAPLQTGSVPTAAAPSGPLAGTGLAGQPIVTNNVATAPAPGGIPPGIPLPAPTVTPAAPTRPVNSLLTDGPFVTPGEAADIAAKKAAAEQAFDQQWFTRLQNASSGPTQSQAETDLMAKSEAKRLGYADVFPGVPGLANPSAPGGFNPKIPPTFAQDQAKATANLANVTAGIRPGEAASEETARAAGTAIAQGSLAERTAQDQWTRAHGNSMEQLAAAEQHLRAQAQTFSQTHINAATASAAAKGLDSDYATALSRQQAIAAKPNPLAKSMYIDPNNPLSAPSPIPIKGYTVNPAYSDNEQTRRDDVAKWQAILDSNRAQRSDPRLPKAPQGTGPINLGPGATGNLTGSGTPITGALPGGSVAAPGQPIKYNFRKPAGVAPPQGKTASGNTFVYHQPQ